MTDLVVTRNLVIPATELRWEFSGSGGPGGQHANTSNTRVSLTWDIVASAAPGPRQRAMLLSRLGPRVRVVVTTSRSQGRNREVALERLRESVAGALHVDPPRRPTTPTRAARERRLDAKRRRASLKQTRSGSDDQAG